MYVIMPQMKGPDLFDWLVKVRPDLRVIYMSGYTGESVPIGEIMGSGAAFLQKPISPDVLARKVRAVLEARR